MTHETDKEPTILGRTPDSPASGVRVVGGKQVNEKPTVISKTQPPEEKK